MSPVVDDALEAMPPLYRPWVRAVLEGPVPRERRATCDECPMVRAEPPAVGFRADTRCCTFHPELPNFLVGAFFREADAPGRRQYFPPDAADIVPVIPCVHLVLAAALGLLGDRPELGLVVEIVRGCAGFLDFEYDPREKAEQLRQYLAAASKALAGVAPDSWLALTRADAGPDRANVALSAAQGAVVRVAALLVARVGPGQVPELVPADLGAFLRSCFCGGFVTHCVPSLAADLRPFMEAPYAEELQAVLASRDALRLLKAVAESTDSLKSAAVKTLPQIRALADRMAETLDVIAYTRDADEAAACVDACFGTTSSSSSTGSGRSWRTCC